jgi:hypothetical protein
MSRLRLPRVSRRGQFREERRLTHKALDGILRPISGPEYA